MADQHETATAPIDEASPLALRGGIDGAPAKGGAFACVIIRREIGEDAARERYQKPIALALAAGEKGQPLGRVLGAGQMTEEADFSAEDETSQDEASFEHSFHAIDLALDTPDRALPPLMAALRRAAAGGVFDDRVELHLIWPCGLVERAPILPLH